MIAAVEFRTTIRRSSATKPLTNRTPPTCAGTKNPPTFFKEDFNQGLRGWTTTNKSSPAGRGRTGSPTRRSRATGRAPRFGETSRAATAAAPATSPA